MLSSNEQTARLELNRANLMLNCVKLEFLPHCSCKIVLGVGSIIVWDYRNIEKIKKKSSVKT